MSKVMVKSENVKAIIQDWYDRKGWKSFAFQNETLDAYLAGKSGILNAPTGSGKTYAMWIPVLAEYIKNNNDYKSKSKSGLQVLWITPLRALAKDIQRAMQIACDELDIPWTVALRTGDTTAYEKQRQKKDAPECLITTPESFHVLLSQKGYSDFFKNIKTVIVDEWHELLGTKRGVQIELGLSRIKSLLENKKKTLKVWGISATIGNLDEAMRVLLGEKNYEEGIVIRSDFKKKIKMETVLPEEIERFPWAGHLGIKLLPAIIKIIDESNSTLVFTNTRSQTEIWYQYLLLYAPHLAGTIALHHSSLDQEVRGWVEDALSEGKLKAVVCTSSLDLGVDFTPVDTVIQIGGPKGVARFIQRAGRSGHQPFAESKVYFVPTNSLELVEGAALKTAVQEYRVEKRKPLELSFDVLTQYMITLAISEGFYGSKLLEELKSTFSFRNITLNQFQWLLQFITTGGESLGSYEEFKKVEVKDDFYQVTQRKVAIRHRLSMGTIVGDPVLKIQYMSGGFIGTIEESFISKLQPGSVFWFAGRNLEYVKLKDLTVFVKKAGSKKGVIPRWDGGRMPLSSQMSDLIREKLGESVEGDTSSPELMILKPLFDIQQKWSHVPKEDELLIEKIESKEGFHVMFYPFEGRYVHEILATVFAYRIAQIEPFSFSISLNDYGFELLSDKEIPIEKALEKGLLNPDNFFEDMHKSINEGEMAKRKFRDIASIAGLVFQGYPGKTMKFRHLQASSQLYFSVFQKYDPDNLLLKQSFQEVYNLQLQLSRIGEAMSRLNQQKVILVEPQRPTPFSFPIMVERFREKMSNEKLEDRIAKMQIQLEKLADKK